MTITATFTCDQCGEPVQVALQLPRGTKLADVAADLEPIDFEARVLHDLSEHLDGLVGA